MRVTVSVPDPLRRVADRAARGLGMTRSQFYVRALDAFLGADDRPDITERLNAVYGKGRIEPDPAFLAHGLEVLRRTQWAEPRRRRRRTPRRRATISRR